EQVALHDIDAAATFHGLRTGLGDIQLAVISILGPLDILRATAVFFHDHGLACHVAHFRVAPAEARTFRGIHFYRLDLPAGGSFFTVDHLDGLAAQVAAQNGRTTSLQRGLVHIEFVRVDRALHHCFAQTVGTGDEHDITEAGLGIQGEHHTGGTGFGTNHAL